MLYNNIYTANDLLNLFVNEEDGYTPKRVNRRKLDDNKESAKENGCRKGYHKSEKRRKQETRRRNRREGKITIPSNINIDAIKDFVMTQLFEEKPWWRVEPFHAEVKPYYCKWKKGHPLEGFWVEVIIDEYDPEISWSSFDVDEDLYEHIEEVYITLSEAINLSF